ncbi:MAG: helix-turn-helix transcriptional regulator [Gammaproteobacteria bacterium]|nr:helix-turn-helix transcriptional regulator [Gammaproteobacteria bacterium]
MSSLPKTDTSTTRNLIITTAERMFATSGIHGVALRAISQASGQGNSVAVQYHFKNRKGLVAAILSQRIERIEARRRELLDELLGDSATLALRDCLYVLQQPLVEMLDNDKRHTFARFLLACYATPDYWNINTGFGVRAWVKSKKAGDNTATMQLLNLISEHLQTTPDRVLAWRILEYVRSITGTIVGWENAVDSGIDMPPLEVLMDDQISMTVVALSAPLSEKTRNYLQLAGASGKKR